MPGKTKTSAYFYTLRFFGGRGWMSRAALLKTAHRAVFAPSSAMSPQLFESTLYDKVSEFCAVHGSLHCCTRRKRKIRTLLQSETGSDFSCLVGAGGFEPPKLKAADLQSVPIGHSGTRPYSLFVSFAGRLVYSIMQKGFCQLFFYLFLQMRFPCRETAG